MGTRRLRWIESPSQRQFRSRRSTAILKIRMNCLARLCRLHVGPILPFRRSEATTRHPLRDLLGLKKVQDEAWLPLAETIFGISSQQSNSRFIASSPGMLIVFLNLAAATQKKS